MKQLKYMALAALVAFAACDEGGDVVVTPEVTGDIAGVVTIEGAPIAGVQVTLSSGPSTVTAADGRYTFTGVLAGAITVKISNYPEDAAFQAVEKALTVKEGLNAADFSGTYIRTSAILGSVQASGTPLSGVRVSLNTSGIDDVFTGAAGNFAFTGLRAGQYNVTISGLDDSRFLFTVTSLPKTVATGQTVTADFIGQTLATSTISGTLYLDGNSNLSMDPGEPPVAKAGITVALERAVGDSIYTTTDANGHYSFPDLEEGTYKVILLPQAAIPGAYSQTGDTRYLAVATSGAATTVNFAFEVTTQYVMVYGMLGTDEVNVGVAPIKGWSINMYPTEMDANASTFPIVTAVKTDANGMSKFKFERSKDYSPNKKVVDGIVFAKVASPGAGYALNGETIIEIPWLPTDSMVMAPDTFDALYGQLYVKLHSAEIDNDTLAGWTFEMRSDKDSVGGGSNTWTNFSNTKGDLVINIDLALIASIRGGNPVVYPDTLWFKLAGFQGGAGGHGFTQTPAPVEGMAHGSFLKYIWDGTNAPGDTLDLGKSLVSYTDSDYSFRIHREQDDSTGVTPTFTTGDGFDDVTLMNVALYTVSSTGTKTLVAGPTAATVGTGIVTFLNMDNTKNYEVRARSTNNGYTVLNDTAIAFTPDKSDQVWNNRTLYRGTGATGTWTPATFAYKANGNIMAGTVSSRLGASPVKGIIVTVSPAAGNIQGTPTKVDTTDAAGAYSVGGLKEGPYTVTVSAGGGVTWSFLRTLKSTTTPAAGAATNDSPTTASRTLKGYSATGTSNFEAYFGDASWSGQIVNDRDTDLTTIDPGEALAGAVINLYRDDDTGAAGMDTLAATATTNSNGAYSFTGLIEGRYTAAWAVGTPSIEARVLRSVDINNVATTGVTAITLYNGPVKSTSVNLPAWSYGTSAGSNLGDANFTFLYSNTVVQGTAKTGALAPVAGMTVTLQRCYTSTANALFPNLLTNVSGPVPDDGASTTCSVTFTGLTNTVTDAAGNFQFSGLAEGVYRITPQPVTAGYVGFTPAGGALNQPGLYLTVGSGDIESLAFTIS